MTGEEGSAWQDQPLGTGGRPAVARVVNDRGLWLFVAIMIVVAGALFGALESRRANVTVPAIAPEPDSEGSMMAPPPELTLPPDWQSPPMAAAPAPAPMATPTPLDSGSRPTVPARPFASEAPRPMIQPPLPVATPSLAPVAQREAPAEVFRATPGTAPRTDPSATKQDRVEATRFSNPATTVPKGTVMQAVLESALDSTRSGMARAIITRDVFGFDGTKVLIPRGSRLIGDYKADVQQGQNRALIEWQRLMRPDGALINLDSPSADPLGRAGVKGKVNGHFFARYTGAILQSALQVGEQVAVNKLAPGTAIFAVPGLYGLQGATPGLGQQPGAAGPTVQPTITVKQGTSVSVFVARDLDFTSVEQ